MASEQVPRPTRAPRFPLARLGFSGTLLLIGGLVGIIAAFLPLVSISFPMQGPGANPAGANPFQMLGGIGEPTIYDSYQRTMSVKVVQDWRGKVGLAGYLAALICAFVLYPPNGLGQKALCWAGVGAGLLVTVLAFWLLIDLMGMGRVTVEIGAVLNIVAGVMVAAGGFLKAREEKLI